MKKGGICIISGEASGDIQASLLVEELKNAFASSELEIPNFWGSTGPALKNIGVETVANIEDLAVFGYLEVILHYSTIARIYKLLLEAIIIRQPLAVIFVDYPGFNLRLLRDVYQLGITTIYHIPPKAWSHGVDRAEDLKKYAYLVTSILPFEIDFFIKREVPIRFVGNPLRDNVEKFLQNQKNIARDPCKIGILPGSRKSEITRILPILILSFVELSKSNKDLFAEIPIATSLSVQFVTDVILATLKQVGINQEFMDEKIKISLGNAYEIMTSAQYIWVCSGTAALETAFFLTPMSSFYKMSNISYHIAKMLVKNLKYITLVNLSANKPLIPEYIQDQMTVENLVNHAKLILSSKVDRANMIEGLSKVKNLFPLNSHKNAVREIFSCIMNYNLSIEEKFYLQRKSFEKKYDKKEY